MGDMCLDGRHAAIIARSGMGDKAICDRAWLNVVECGGTNLQEGVGIG
jgi:hypothetical protein